MQVNLIGERAWEIKNYEGTTISRLNGYNSIEEVIDGHWDEPYYKHLVEIYLPDRIYCSSAYRDIMVLHFGQIHLEMELNLVQEFESDLISEEDYLSARAAALYAALRANEQTISEYELGSLPDGRWAMIGLPIEGHKMAIEAISL